MKPGPPNQGDLGIRVDGNAIGLVDSNLFQNGSKLTVFEESEHPTNGLYHHNLVQIDWLTGERTLLGNTFDWRGPQTDGVRYGEGQILVLDLFEDLSRNFTDPEALAADQALRRTIQI